MNTTRREFLRTGVGAVAAPAMILCEAAKASATQPLTNWAGNYRYSTTRLRRAKSVDEVREFVRRHDRLKVLGTRHCFNGIADSTHRLLSLAEMNDAVSVDKEARTVTVQA